MIEKIVLAFLAMFAASPVPTRIGWQKDNTVIVHFVADPNTIDTACGGPLPQGIILACVNRIGGDQMMVPNPCVYKDYDPYARMLCHELAHTNFWRHEYN